MTGNETRSTDIFAGFCGDVPFWDEKKLDQDIPEFSICFLDTVLIWSPCAFLWILAPFFVLYVHKCRKYTPLPFSALNISKGIFSCLVACAVIVQLILQEHDGYACDKDLPPTPAAYTAVGLKFGTFVLTIILQQIQRHRGVKTSGVPFCFWMFLILCEILPLYTHIARQTMCGEDIAYYIYYVLICVQFILHCFAEQPSRQGYYEISEENPCPDESASVLSQVMFEWLTPVVWKSYRRTLDTSEFWDQTSRLRSDYLGTTLEDAWKDEINRCNTEKKKRKVIDEMSQFKYQNGAGLKNNHAIAEHTPLLSSSSSDDVSSEDTTYKPKLYWALWKVFYLHWCEATSYMGVAEVVWLVQPIVLRFIIQMIENKGTEYAVEAEWQGYFYSLLLFITLCSNSFMYHVGFHHIMCVGLKVKTALICLIYKKALTMKRGSSKATTVGEIVNHMSVDCQRIQDGFLFSFYIVLIVVIIIIAFVQLWDLMGVASFGGLAVLLIILPIVGFIATKQYTLQNDLLYLKGTRIKILNEVISGIKVLKMYAWEPSFMKKIQAIRSQEIDKLWSYAVYVTTAVLFAVHSPFMIMFVLILIYVLTSPTHSLGAEETFTALSIINILRFPIALCPFLVNGMVQAFVSIKRIQEFLWTEDLSENNVKFLHDSPKEGEEVLSVQSADFTWSADRQEPTLRSISMNVEEGELVAVVGHVGTGKSSLVQACLGEMERLCGTITVRGKIAYVPQEAWIQNMTLRDNILFGKKYNERKYQKVLEACALLPDLKILSGGDMTEIGEKGINISGGQKQRVSLARAVYSNADLYFLDDPLSAVDSHVGKHLFKKVVGNEGLLRHKTRILVTHGVHWLPNVDRILVLNNGTITESGTYDELISQNGAFAQFLLQYLQQDEQEDEDPEIRQLKDTMYAKVEEIKSDGAMTSDDEGLTKSGRMRRRSTRISAYSRSASKVDETAAKPAQLSRLTADETSEEGAIKFDVLLTYFRAVGIIFVFIVLIAVSLFQGLNVFSNFWLTYWTEDELLKNTSLANTPEYEDKYLYYLIMYLVLGVIQGIAIFLGFYLALTRMVVASGKLHNNMLTTILKSPMSFFDTTPIGRMMNRFSSDVDIMDNKLPESFRLWTIMIFSTLAIIVVVSVTTPIFIAAIVPIGIFYIFCVRFYLPTARLMRRTESVCRSPIYNHFSETITGSAVIRAYKCAARFVVESRKRVDKNIKFYYAANTGGRWVGIRLELLGNVIVLLATIFALVSDDLTGAQVGLSISYAVMITITMNLVVLAVSELEMNVVSAERVTEYTKLPSEAGWVLESARPPPGWPRTGKIEFRGFTTRYREGLDLVLRGIDCTVGDGEKVGIVGRTGAGKSSLTLCLFRLIESAGGSILIDGIDISKIGLHDLRAKLTILPQDPVLFSGSLRNNLDPFERFDDEAMWYALECAHLKDFVRGLLDGLAYECGEGGQNLSVGQRQLVCLARTLLHKTKVLILDEATAAVDMETDDLIQETIRTQFKDCTIITVAHRLNTIMDYDRVMVLDAGLIKEFDAPSTLLKDHNGVFFGMAKDAGLI